MDKYLRKHLWRQTPAEKSLGGRSPQPHSSPGKGRGGQLKHMKESPPSKGKGAPNLFYYRPTDDRGGPCHAPECDGSSSWVLELQRKRKTKDGQEVKLQDRFRCTITCGYCGKRRHYEDECHIKRRESKKHNTAEEKRRKNATKLNPKGRGRNPGGPPGEENPCGGLRSSASPTGGRGTPNPTSKGEQPDDKWTVPFNPGAGGASKGDNAKISNLNLHCKCLQAAEVEVNFPEEG